jgi:hypothetical protein
VLATKEGRSFFTDDYQAFLDQREGLTTSADPPDPGAPPRRRVA